MVLSKTGSVMRAADRAQAAEEKVREARRALARAERAWKKAEARYAELVSEMLARTSTAGQTA